MIVEAAGFGLQHAIISTHPRILLVAIGGGDTGFKRFSDGTTSIEHLCDIVGPGGHLIMNPWWYISDTPEWQHILNGVLAASRQANSTGLQFFCNEQAEVAYLAAVGLSGTYLNQNAFTNENVFYITNSEKKFDAIYNAKFVPFKRHELARAVPNLALMYSRYGELEQYFPRISALLPHAAFLNGDPTSASYEMFDPGQVRENLNRARTGLCLSHVEGAMYASMEYLLCGLPVVSTHSFGGREAFFDERFCKIVSDDPADIAEAVRDLGARNIDPNFIRNETLLKI